MQEFNVNFDNLINSHLAKLDRERFAVQERKAIISDLLQSRTDFPIELFDHSVMGLCVIASSDGVHHIITIENFLHASKKVQGSKLLFSDLVENEFCKF